MTKIEKHEVMCKNLHELYIQKNKAYGDSFGETYRKLGIISAVTRISDKYNRLVNLATHRDINTGDESLKDTLVDLANYALMTAMEIDEETKAGEVRAGDYIISSDTTTGVSVSNVIPKSNPYDLKPEEWSRKDALAFTE